jgi:SAM-dependent methyltransferase
VTTTPNLSADLDAPKLPTVNTVIGSEARADQPDQPVFARAEPSTPTLAPRPRRTRPILDLLLISFLILFYELACIRFFGSMVVFLTFFTNIVLIACFLGMSVGCTVAGRRRNYINWVLPLSMLSVSLALGVFAAYQRWGSWMIDVGGQSSPQLIYFGTEYRPRDPSKFVIPIEAVAGGFFVLIALTFVGLGQEMGRAFDAIPGRITAYTANVFGSLIGIVAFFAASWFRTSPHVWFVVAILLCLYFVRPWRPLQVFSAIGALFIVALVSYGAADHGQTFWSPYYKIRYTPQTGEIDTNNIAHQQMLRIAEAGPAYMLPHLLNRDAGGKPFEDVLIIGAGSGNDVSASLRSGARHVDAVEIDPVINQRGKEDHPDKPYADENRVKVWYDDGRSFLHKPNRGPYDLAVYALVDSLVLHSGFSSLRLENFLFTEQAFADVKAKLKPGGVFAMYNYYRQGWVVGRLAKMAKTVFGTEPLVVSLPFQPSISPSDNQSNHITFLLVGLPDSPGGTNATVEAIRQKFAQSGTFWLNQRPAENDAINGFASAAPTASTWWQKIAPASVDIADITRVPTDNWPFLYLRDAAIPTKPTLVGIAIVGGLSIVILLAFTWPVWFGRSADTAELGRAVPSGRMFFLGAGFMLLETKGVVHMALLFGSTWIVNSVVFFAILVMILLANLYVAVLKPRNLIPFYALLAVALIVNAIIPMDRFLALPGATRTVVSCGVIFVPIFFAAVIFATSFRDSRRPDLDMGSNIAGVILGGLSENLSMVLGFNKLLWVALGFYALSYVFKRRPPDVGMTFVSPERAAQDEVAGEASLAPTSAPA